MKFSWLFLAWFYHSSSSFAHEDVRLCGTESPLGWERRVMAETMEDWYSDNDTRRELQSLQYTVPVFITLLHPAFNTGYLTDEMAEQMMSELNEGYKDTPFTFQLKGTTRIVQANYSLCKNKKEFMTKYKKGSQNKALNIYLCNANADGFVGRARMPAIVLKASTAWEDGVLLMNPALSSSDEYTIEYVSQVLIHEVGHWLGLLHTFEGSCSDEKAFRRTYGGENYYYENGDGVLDTPSHRQGTKFETESRYCWIGQNLNTCPDQARFGDMGMDPVDNYMNYLPPRCFKQFGRFTPGQVERMVAQYQTFRLCKSRGKCTSSKECCGKNRRCIKSGGSTQCRPCRRINQACSRNSDCCGKKKCQRRNSRKVCQ